MMNQPAPDQSDNQLLVVEDDNAFRNQLMLTMKRRGFEPHGCASISEALDSARFLKPAYAIVDMRLNDGNGLELVPDLKKLRDDIRVVILTGYGNIASAVAAVKVGAVDYLAKPAEPDDIAATLLAPEGCTPPPPENPMSADRVKWEHIQRVFELCDRNVSETARRLNMHRRTLQRILAKRSPH